MNGVGIVQASTARHDHGVRQDRTGRSGATGGGPDWSAGPPARAVLAPHSLVTGALAGLALAGVFVAVVAGSAGSAHLGWQVRTGWWLLAPPA